MNKKDTIAREILGWKTRSQDSWYDVEKDVFVHESYFKPEKYMKHAMLIVKRLDMFGITYSTNGVSEVHFDDVTGTGATLPEAITNAAYSLIENYYSIPENRY
ncbi:hypothetical protein JMM81_10840 [Bacillus sp. V3B]|uniref:BC1872 family protein n=1 Tax=Bacillus sp. V3B TaxID=2804915 RepID=UPI00210B2FCE|nr:hypothetical protein [Bacillus sp. V3B]MCQ6275454.1 hypothetical protein [Bacillus sp. V3B]